MDIYEQTVAERELMLGELRELSLSQWDAPTLCEGWKVCDVVAHLCAGVDWKMSATLVGIARNGFKIDEFLKQDAISQGDVAVDDLIGRFERVTHSRRRPPMAKPIDVLQEVVAHRHDILLALDTHGPVEPQRMRAVLDFASSSLRSSDHPAHDLKLNATDVDWSVGSGQLVSGPSQEVLMVLLQRRFDLPRLSGDGHPILQSRLMRS